MLAESFRWLATTLVIPATGGSAVITELFAVADGVGGGRLCPVEPPVVAVVPPIAELPPPPTTLQVMTDWFKQATALVNASVAKLTAKRGG